MGLHHVMRIVVTYGEFFLPGEAVEEVRAAWRESDPLLAELIQDIADGPDLDNSVDLEPGHLLGASGRMKREFLNREYPAFMARWGSRPEKKVQLQRARKRAAQLADAGATVLGSIPGGEPFAEVVDMIGKHVLHRFKRGY